MVERDVYTKKEFVERYTDELRKSGLKVSKTKAWEIAKLTVDTMFEMSFEKPLSLGGIGRLGYISSGRSAAKGQGKLLPRFKPSSRIALALNEGGVGEKEVDGEKVFYPEAPAKLISEPCDEEEEVSSVVDEVAEENEKTSPAPKKESPSKKKTTTEKKQTDEITDEIEGLSEEDLI